eukprot:scaffold88885_cov49-Phaeocystis_antarctica.AAC.4
MAAAAAAERAESQHPPRRHSTWCSRRSQCRHNCRTSRVQDRRWRRRPGRRRAAARAERAERAAAAMRPTATVTAATDSFPNPSSSHSQQRQRPRCPPMRNG